jgi:acyl-CoA dehydrogenase
MGTPICITVEGANILTRTLMIFGQGAIRCHPFAYREIDALAKGDVAAFDRAFWGHIGHVVQNGVRALLLSVTRGWLQVPPVAGPGARYWRKLAWASASFAFLADVAMGMLGGDLKRREKVTGRFADIFSWLYLGTAALRRFEADGRKQEDVALMRWTMEHALHRMQVAFDGLYANLPLPTGLRWLFRGPLLFWSRLNPLSAGPGDRLGAAAAKTLLQPGAQRDRLSWLVHLDPDPASALGRLDHALALCSQADAIQRRLKDAVKQGKLQKGRPDQVLAEGLRAGLVSEAEAQLLQSAEQARAEAIAVDSFTLEEYRRLGIVDADVAASAH